MNHTTFPVLQTLPEVYEDEGYNGSKFAHENFSQKVALLHFIEEGKNSFYVTGYYGNDCEVIGYGGIDISRRRPRFMSRVWLYPVIEHIVGDDFIRVLLANNIIRIKGNDVNFDVQFTRVPLEGGNGGHGYELNKDTWQTIVQ
ncbi:hypothetical protein Tco_1346862 [Tanacetum coccineum]